ncbi:peptidase S8/S53 subtilisin kexin sedolisin [Saccharothrix sp. NRRL B-16348]|uniref:type VII secretion-associated serine protease mycosin n=1 Tax=Saccharothrix sp. NRRL B-16348 TaxID=1415542 RepID=UPI0006AE47BE|nr:type VII secretion-associated serine protease mycosin [Saccharothrix sp. NRRL B-16348]KOX22987.1 peptidase S8/S53 subtilisin kexin sedolisin [Saccharothrix sp. NRRL B-16348]
MRIRKIAALAAAAVTLVTAPGAYAQPTSTKNPGTTTANPTTTTNAAASRPNSQPPPVDRSFLRAPESPAEDVDYQPKQGCIISNTENRPIPNKPWGQMQLRLEEAHRFATGKGVKLAVIDTGVNKDHPRLLGRVEAGGDYVETEKRGVHDCDGHGTEVAGVAAASKDEATGFVGAAPDVTVLAFRQTSNSFKFEHPTNRQLSRDSAGKVGTLAKAIVSAVAQGANVINISLTACALPSEPSDQERELQAAINWAVNDKNVVIVTAAGNIDPKSGCQGQNDNQDPNNVNVVASPPWYADDVLSVASMNSEGGVSPFSVWGPWVSVAAPGENIVTLDPAGQGLTNANFENNRPVAIQGTSFAAPYVAGVVALVRERFPDLTARQVMDRIKATAQHPGNPDGRDHKVGYGMINPVAALTAELPFEQSGQKRPTPEQLITNLGPLNPPSSTPMIVALSGTGAGVGLLLLTLFIVHTVNRNRARRGV